MKKKASRKPAQLAPIADFLYEVGMLAKTPRSGFFFLGSGKQSVSEHITRTAYIGYALAMLENKNGGAVDAREVMKLCLFHDLGEARTSDLNYVHQKYAVAAEDKALVELTAKLPFGPDILKTFRTFEERKTPEAQLAKDADQLELILSLREQADIGNKKAHDWLPNALKRLKSPVAQELSKAIMETHSDNWHFPQKNDAWWVNRNGLKK